MGLSEYLSWKMLQAKVSSMNFICNFSYIHYYGYLAFGVSNFCYLLCRFLRINLPVGGHPVGVTFSDDDASSVVVASQALAGTASLYMYGEEKPKNSDESKQQTKLPLPEMKWERHKVHDKNGILTLFGSAATYGSADGSTIIASSSESTFDLSNICMTRFYLCYILRNLSIDLEDRMLNWIPFKVVKCHNCSLKIGRN